MGIKNLNALINIFAPNSITKKKFEDFKGKKIAIDASLLIYQYVIAIRNTAGDLTNTEGDMTSHIHAVVSKSLLYLDNEIIPIFQHFIIQGVWITAYHNICIYSSSNR